MVKLFYWGRVLKEGLEDIKFLVGVVVRDVKGGKKRGWFIF